MAPPKQLLPAPLPNPIIRLACLILFALAIATVSQTVALAQQPADPNAAQARAQEILKQAREALGGEANLKAVQSLAANGNFKTAIMGRLVQGDFKIG